MSKEKALSFPVLRTVQGLLYYEFTCGSNKLDLKLLAWALTKFMTKLEQAAKKPHQGKMG
ncbi:hypothetical protein Lal_00025242 [Lupinus albus]|nr:hypothetical protein Lal_00025242 [Lupinus albus]